MRRQLARRPKEHRMRRSTLLVIALLATAPAHAQPAAGGPPAVGVIVAEQRPVTEQVDFIGRIEATDRVDLRARVTGFLEERLFREGQEVRTGEVLFRMERAPFEAEVARQQAAVAAAEAELTNSRIQLARARDLLRTQAGTQARVDDLTAAERAANAQLLAAQAALRVAAINLGYTEIISPITGKIGRTNVSVGNVVGPTAGTLASIVSQDPMYVAFAVSVRQGSELQARFAGRGGTAAVRVRIRLTSGETYEHTGEIVFVDNQIDRNTDTVLVRARIANPAIAASGPADRRLIDGAFVTATVEGTEPVMAILIPRAAVLQDQQGSYVFVLDDGNRAERRAVRLGRSTAETAVVEGGLRAGDRVVSEGLQRVRPGDPVAPLPAQGTPTRPPAPPRG
jgi:membrane fusion protein, multidrug efflux system